MTLLGLPSVCQHLHSLRRSTPSRIRRLGALPELGSIERGCRGGCIFDLTEHDEDPGFSKILMLRPGGLDLLQPSLHAANDLSTHYINKSSKQRQVYARRPITCQIDPAYQCRQRYLASACGLLVVLVSQTAEHVLYCGGVSAQANN